MVQHRDEASTCAGEAVLEECSEQSERLAWTGRFTARTQSQLLRSVIGQMSRRIHVMSVPVLLGLTKMSGRKRVCSQEPSSSSGKTSKRQKLLLMAAGA